MANINIDGKDYEIESLPKKARDLIKSLQFVGLELERQKAKTAVCRTARTQYFDELKKEIAAHEKAAGKKK